MGIVFFQQSIGDIRMESARTTISGNLLLEKSLVSKKISSFNGSLQFLSGESMQMSSGESAFILGNFLPILATKLWGSLSYY